MNETKRFLKTTTAYFFGNILSRMLSFFMLPFYTAYISPEAFGYYDLTINYAVIITSVLFLDIWCGIMRFMFDSNEQQEKLKTIYSALPIYGGSLLLYIITFSVLNARLGIQYFPLVLLYGALTTLSSMYAYIIRGYGKSVFFACSGLVCTSITVLLNLILIAGFHQPYWSLYAAASVGILVQIIMLECSVRLIPNFSVRLIDQTLLKKMLHYSFPLLFNSVAYCFLNGFNRIVIVSVLGEAQNGYFAIANKFAIVINLIGTCFFLAYQETSFRKEGERSGSCEYYTKASDLYVKFLLLGTACMMPAIGIAFRFLVNSSYVNAKVLIPLCLLGTAVSLFCSFLHIIFAAIKETRMISVAALTASAVNVVLLVILIRHVGVQAANISFLIGNTVNCTIGVVLLHKKIGFRLSLKPFLLYIPLLSAVTYLFQACGIVANAAALLVTAIIMLVSFQTIIKSLFTNQ